MPSNAKLDSRNNPMPMYPIKQDNGELRSATVHFDQVASR
jgi:hypothetical protein